LNVEGEAVQEQEVFKHSNPNPQNSTFLEKFFHNLLHADAFGFGFEVAHQAMAQDRHGHGADILDIGRVLAIEEGVALGTYDEVLGGPGASAPFY
jgi:hypothetical protein